MYTEEQHKKALSLYDEYGSVTKTMVRLGYPSQRQIFYNWINRHKYLPIEHPIFCGANNIRLLA